MTVEVPDDIRASARFKCANATSTIIKKNGSHRVQLHRAAQKVAPRRSLGLALWTCRWRAWEMTRVAMSTQHAPVGSDRLSPLSIMT